MSDSLGPHGQAPLSMEILQVRILEWVAMPSSISRIPKKKKKKCFLDYKLYTVVRISYILNKCRCKCIKENTEKVRE